ncbi:MAG TPA: DNA polymerase Y family protein [Vicinamibacterales bacterium]|nr:DNA polymerase Y family protein [Vicinamibacterales bacterium]
MFGALLAAEGTLPGALADVAREFSPRIDIGSQPDRDVALDLSGVERLFGDARTIADELRRTAADRGIRVRVAIAGTRTAARLLVRHRVGLTVIEPGNEAAALAALPIALVADPAFTIEPHDLLATFRQWGVRTLGELAALPSDDLAARLGADGLMWQRLARGEDPRPLVPSMPEERFAQSLDLEWPIEELEPLSFVLSRLMEPLSVHLERRDRGAAVLHVRLHLVKIDDTTPEVHERSLQLPAPMRDARTLRTLALLDLESNPPPAPIDRVEVAVDPTPGRIVQFSLLTRALPTPERLSTLLARLHALMGETRCGSPALVDSWKPGVFEMKSFAPVDANVVQASGLRPGPALGPEAWSLRPDSKPPRLALRRFRHPIPARVRVKDAQPEYVAFDRRGLSGGGVESCAGPWRTTGDWWREGWDRDEWDVTVSGGTTYRLFRARDTDRWFVEGVVD